MAASDNLSGPLFHGTIGKFKKGDIILPAAKLGRKQSNWGMRAHESAFATEHLGAAKYFANSSFPPREETQKEYSIDIPEGVNFMDWLKSQPKVEHKPEVERVYEVEPVGPTKLKNLSRGRHKYAEAIVEHSSPEGFKVKRQVWSRERTFGLKSRQKMIPRPKGLN